MASSVIVEVHGKRTSVQAKPMKPVQEIIHAALDASKLSHLDASTCTLMYNGKPLDLTTPFRFANIPTGAKLTLITGHEPKLGVVGDASDTQVASTPAAAAPAKNTPHSAPPPAPAATQTTAVSQVEGAKPMAAAVQQGGSPAHASQQIANASQQDASPTSSPPLYIFHRRDLEATQQSSSSTQQNPESDDFYTFTEADYHVVMAGYAARAKQQGQHLKTSAMRAAEETSRAASFSHVPVRVQLPDGHIVQSVFTGTDPLAAVRARLQPLLLPEHTGWYLYTTPPKTKLKEEQQSLYALRLVPAALLYVGCDAPAGDHGHEAWVAPHALEAHGGLPPRVGGGDAEQEEGSRQQHNKGNGKGNGKNNGKGPAVVGRYGAPSIMAFEPYVPEKPEGGGRKVPKWMKL